MSDLDQINVLTQNREQMEQVDPRFAKEKLYFYQNKTWKVLNEIRSNLSEELTEDGARRLALEIFEKHGVKKHWHKPYIRFGKGTTLTFHEPLQPEYTLKKDDAVYIDIGPIWLDQDSGLLFEGDVGETFVFGENKEIQACADTAKGLFLEVQDQWQKQKLSGKEIYNYLQKRTLELGYIFVGKVDGHRTGDFPHQKYSKERLAKLDFCPNSSLWVLEIQINDPQLRFGAFYEDIL
ncbi:MAG: M24 family metallopeptidase [Bacteriovoracia bacterium]